MQSMSMCAREERFFSVLFEFEKYGPRETRLQNRRRRRRCRRSGRRCARSLAQSSAPHCRHMCVYLRQLLRCADGRPLSGRSPAAAGAPARSHTSQGADDGLTTCAFDGRATTRASTSGCVLASESKSKSELRRPRRCGGRAQSRFRTNTTHAHTPYLPYMLRIARLAHSHIYTRSICVFNV